MTCKNYYINCSKKGSKISSSKITESQVRIGPMENVSKPDIKKYHSFYTLKYEYVILYMRYFCL